MYQRIRSEDVGHLEASPTRFPVDSHQPFTLRYTAGKRPITPGGRVRLLTPRFFSTPNLVRRNGRVGWSHGFTCITEKPDGVELEISIEAPAFSHWITTDIVLTVVSGSVEPGQQVTVQYGGNLSKVQVAKMAGKAYAFRALVDPDGSAQGPHSGYLFAANDVELELLPGEPLRTEVYVPSVVADESDPGTVLVVRKDAHHNVVSAESLVVTSSECSVVPSKDGRARRIEVRDHEAGVIAQSNPCTDARPDGLRLFWGDLHVHTGISDDTFSEGPDAACVFARDKMGHDFLGFADHVNHIRAEEWQETLEAARTATVPDEFVVFPGFEFNSREAPEHNGRRLDKNVYYLRTDDATLPEGVSRDDHRSMASPELLDTIDLSRQMIIPHQHPGGVWDVAGREKMRVVEIYSHWGGFERPGCEHPLVTGPYPPGAFVSEALAAGMRLGFVGGSDNHTSHPGNDFLWPHGNYHGGLTAIWAADNTAEALSEALYRRQCYATTRARIWLRFSVNGAQMGAELKLAARDEARCIEAEIHGTSPILEVSVMRNSEFIETWTPDDWDFTVSWADEAPLSGRGWDYYYLRVKQTDGEMAWSSPVWTCV